MRTGVGARPAPLLVDLLEPASAVSWYSNAQTQALLEAMSPAHQEQVIAMALGGMTAACAVDAHPCVESGKKVKRADVRFNGKTGRVRQVILVIANGGVASRHLSTCEAERITSAS